MSDRLHPLLRHSAEDHLAGRLTRREFLGQATALGISTAAASAIIGAPAPAQASAIPRHGGTLRIQQNVKALRDPRSYDWSEMGNMTRGFLEYLVEYQRNGSFHGMLAESWEVNEEATRYTFTLRKGVTWSNGEALTADHVAENFRRWCDARYPGNSMSSRMTALMDAPDGQLRPDAITIEDAHRLTLHLSAPDVTLIANLSDYPAAIVHPSFTGEDPFAHGIGTGPFRPVEMVTGQRCVLERNTDREWWGSRIFGGPYLDRIEFLDYGTDPSTWAAAAEAGEIDLLYESVGTFIDVMDMLGWTASSVDSAATCVIRANQLAEIDGAKPYADLALRRALAQAVDNGICLELGHAGRGVVAANHHVSPIQPAYRDIGPAPYDLDAARAYLSAHADSALSHELVTIDDEWQRNTGDAVVAQLRDAGFDITRRIIPGDSFWENWRSYPFALTQWNHRPLAVQVLSLAYRSGAAWNETGFANPEFDALLDRAMTETSTSQRQKTMGQLQKILRDEAVIIQPFWRRLYTHHSGTVVNAEKHPSHEMHLYKFGFAV